MTKKHFVAMAAAFRNTLTNAKGADARIATIECIEGFMRVAAETNSRFDYARFRLACGM
jgi:hypothetical protein